MELKFKVFAHVSRPAHEVFEAVADPAKLSGYFSTGGAQGRLEAGKTVTWDFHDFPGRFSVDVAEVVPDCRIVLKWAANEGSERPGYQTTVTIEFTPLDGDTRTLVSITEEGWRENDGALASSFG
jgi:uncharacterized protein YndB with AHSA1/START domain